jgi:hypothetical protein
MGRIASSKQSIPFKTRVEGTAQDSTSALVFGDGATAIDIQIGMKRVTESNRGGHFRTDPAGSSNLENPSDHNRLTIPEIACHAFRAGVGQNRIGHPGDDAASPAFPSLGPFSAFLFGSATMSSSGRTTYLNLTEID